MFSFAVQRVAPPARILALAAGSTSPGLFQHNPTSESRMHTLLHSLRWPALLTAAVILAPQLSAQNSGGGASAAASSGWDPQAILKAETWVKPPSSVTDIIMTPRVDISFTSPNAARTWFMRATGDARGDIQLYGKPHSYLGGLQVDTKANRARSLTTSTRHGIDLVDPKTGATRTLTTPTGASISSPVWSPSGTQIAFIANFDDASYVYVADVATGKSAAMHKTPLLATINTDVDWTADGRSILAVLVPEGRGPAPEHGKNGVEDGPRVRLTESRAVPQPIHASLLQDPHDKAQLKYYSTGQLALIDVKTKAIRKVGTPRMIRSVDASSDGAYFRVTVMMEPFSYLVPQTNFGSVQELWDASGKLVTTLATTPLREVAAADGPDAAAAGRGGAAAATDTGKRNIQWNPVGPGLVYLQSVFTATGAAPSGGAGGAGGAGGGRGGRGGAPNSGRGGAAARPQPTGVKYMQWLPPFGANDMKVIYEGGPQTTAVAYSADAKTMFVTDSGATYAIRTNDMSRKYNLGRSVTIPAASGRGFGGGGGGGRGGADTTNVGGALAVKIGPNGQSFVTVTSDGKAVMLTGTKVPASRWNTEAPRPWVDRMEIETATRTRVFESPVDAFDEFIAPLNDDYTQFLYRHESPKVIPDVYLRDVAANSNKKLTSNRDVSPAVSNAIHKRLQVTRPRDGNTMWVDVTLPQDWTPAARLPGIIWFYPYEYTSQAEYERSRYATNINRFPDIPASRPASSTKLWVTQGYAVIEPDIPIWGDSGRMNDNYTRDLKENLDAVVDAVVEAGFVDRNKMGIGGHSYGAFSTVNALTLTPYFKAGIAGDGMYNRSLTPFGFQSERRNFFQAQQMYLDMSPFYRADKIAGALLMYHAIEDQNTGTAPISSQRMLLALQGLGKPAALYEYPYEDHSVATYTSDLDLWARWLAWFDVYVKNPKSGAKPAAFTP